MADSRCPGIGARPRRRWIMVALAGVLAFLPAAGEAQGAGAAVLRGVIRDSAGVAVQGADVTLRDSVGDLVAATVSDAQGRYIMVGLPAGGPYTLSAEHIGYTTGQAERVHLAAGSSRRLDLVLSTRALELPEIVVSAPDMVFSGTRTGAVTVIEERALETLPAIERDITGFAVLSPMVSVDQGAIAVAGQNTRFNSLRVDGALSQDLFGLSPSGVPGGQANAKALPLDAIRQYSVLVAPYDVRQSGFTGGVLNAVTRSGGDRWEGDAFAYYRDDLFSRARQDTAVRSDATGTIEDFRSEIAGLTFGGPIGPARLFVAGEYEQRRRPVPGFNLGDAETLRVGLITDSVQHVSDILATQYGLDAGALGSYTLENPLGNVFARLDIPLGGKTELTVHYNWISADEDLPPEHLGFDPYQLGSTATRLTSRTHSGMARFSSRLGEHTTNELMFNVQHTADRTRAASSFPLVEVDLRGIMDTLEVHRRVQAGADPLAHANALDQTVIQVADHISHATGDHLFTTGFDGALLSVRRLLLLASRGIWRFDSPAALQADAPSSYERLVLTDGTDPDVTFSILQVAGYVQDEWSVSDDLSLTLGFRLDLPITLSRPGYNREAEFITGQVTDRLPSSAALFSPRIGLNWSPETRRRLQVRGGIGVFSGVPPMAWLANAYSDTGLRTGFLQCDGALAPTMTPDSPPSQCADGSATLAPNLTVFDQDFHYPQDLRVSLAVDRELPGGVVATVEGLYTRALNQVALEDLNLNVPTEYPYPANTGFPDAVGPRDVFGVPLVIPTRFGPYEGGRRWSEFGHVIRVGNRSRNAALAVATELQRRFSDRLDIRLAYTYTRAVDVRSLLYQDASLNYGLTPVRFDPARPETQLSAFGRPHRVLASVWTRLLEWGGGLDLTLLYVGQSGLPYSYVYASDVNGDGFPGPGVLQDAYNDLFFWPRDLSDVEGSIMTKMLVHQLFALEDCLDGLEATIGPRNICRTPWSNRLDVRLSQGIRLPFVNARITADVMNVLNLLNSDWGLVQSAPPVVPILELNQREGCPGFLCSITNPLRGQYVGPRKLNPATGLPQATKPYTLSLPESVWRAQIGVRVSF